MTLTPVVDIRSGRRKKMKAAGTKREVAEVHRWQDEGWIAFRTPASMGVCDVIAMRGRTLWNGTDRPWIAAELRFIECKANTGSPFKSFLPADRQALRIAARLAGATPLLVHWPPNGERRVIPASEWPPDGEAAAA